MTTPADRSDAIPSLVTAPPAGQSAIDPPLELACDRLRREWQPGCRLIEELVASAPADRRPFWLRRLLSIEIGLARSSGSAGGGDHAALEPLRSRFPSDADTVRAAWDLANQTRVSWLSRPSRPLGSAADAVTLPAAVCTTTRYSGLRLFRRGGMADLLIAHDEELGRETIVKTLRRDYAANEELRAQFAAEAEITGRLDHPGIVPVFGVGQDIDGHLFYAMQVIRGRDLHTEIQEAHAERRARGGAAAWQRRRLDLIERLIAVCNTVAYAHDAGVLHCDLKPLNVMVGRYGETYVVDWGLATTFDRPTELRNEATVAPRQPLQSDQRGYTKSYVSPEQYRQEGILHPCSDVYSLGATLYEILTGAPPIPADDPNFSDLLTSGRYPAPRSIDRSIPRPVDAICRKALEVAPHKRYQTAKELAADLRNWLRDDEVTALRDGPIARGCRQARRHRVITAAVAVALPLLAIAATWIGLTTKHAKLAESRFIKALDTFEKISQPLAEGEKSNLEVIGPLASDIEAFAADFLKDHSVAAAQRARVLELQSLALGLTDPGSGKSQESLEKAESFYGSAGDDLVTRYRLACNLLRQGRHAIEADPADARQHLEKALAGLEDVADEDERVLKDVELVQSRVKRRLAEAHHDLGRAYLALAENPAAGKPADNFDASEHHFQKGLTLRRELDERSEVKDPYERRAVRRDLARSSGFLGDLHLRRGQIDTALDDYEQSLKSRRALLKTSPGDPETRFQCARGEANFAWIELVEKHDLAKALEHLEEACKLQAELVADFSEDLEFNADLGVSLQTLAELALFADLSASATVTPATAERSRKWLEDARDLFTRLGTKDPHNDEDLAWNAALLAEVLLLTDPDAARASAEEAAKLLAKLDDGERQTPEREFVSAIVSGVLGKPEEAKRALRDALAKGGNSFARYEAHLRLGLASLQADESVAKAINDNRAKSLSAAK